ncbi:MAG: hypothetical protein ABWK04_05160 [Hydrogenobacter sp.]|uniref:hypothetical protein n=1 Tax=Hydrogenobacter thermophilus TaxID=940 RepID=UPI0030F9CCDB
MSTDNILATFAYSKFRLLAFSSVVILFSIALLSAPIWSEDEDFNPVIKLPFWIEFTLFKIVAPLMGILAISLLLSDVLNTSRIELYNDRIVKKVRIKICIFEEALMLLKNVYFLPFSNGVLYMATIKEGKLKNRIIIYVFLMSRDTEELFLKKLSEISGREVEEFKRRTKLFEPFKPLLNINGKREVIS